MLKPHMLFAVLPFLMALPCSQAQGSNSASANIQNESPAQPVEIPFPSSAEFRSKLKIRLVRHGCFGMCPRYTVTLFGDGKLLYEGEEFVRVKGRQKRSLSGAVVDELIGKINDMHFLSFQPRKSTTCVEDGPTASISVSEPGREKQVDDYCLDREGLEQMEKLENAVDDAVEIQRWVFINAAELQREIDRGWDVVEHGQEYADEAIDWDDPEVLRLLVKNGVPVDTTDEDGNTFLFRAVLRNRYKAAKVLLELGANPKTRDFDGWSPAQNAAHRSIEMCRLFLDRGVAINEQDGEGQTMLMNAAGTFPTHLDTVKFLVKSGAALNLRNQNGETALRIAKSAKRDFQQLIDFTSDPNYPKWLGDPERKLAELATTLKEYQAIIDFLKQNGGEE